MKKLLYRDRLELVILTLASVLLILFFWGQNAQNLRSSMETEAEYRRAIQGMDEKIEKMQETGSEKLQEEMILRDGYENTLTELRDFSYRVISLNACLAAKLLTVLLVILQFVKWVLLENRRGREFSATLPITRGKAASYEMLTGVLFFAVTYVLYMAGQLGLELSMQHKLTEELGQAQKMMPAADYLPESLYVLAMFGIGLLLYTIVLLAKAMTNTPGSCLFLVVWGYLMLVFYQGMWRFNFNLSLQGKLIYSYNTLYETKGNEIAVSPWSMGLLCIVLLLVAAVLFCFVIRMEKRRNLAKNGGFQYEWMPVLLAVVSAIGIFIMTGKTVTIFEISLANAMKPVIYSLTAVLAAGMGYGLYYVTKEK